MQIFKYIFYLRACLKISSANFELDEKLNLLLANARYLKETIRLQQAISLLQRLHYDKPEEPYINASLADAYYAAGHWMKANYYINKAIDVQSRNKDFRDQRKDIVWDHLPYTDFNFEYRETGEIQKERFYRLNQTAFFSNYTTIATKYERDHINILEFTDLSGEVISFKGYRQRGELSIRTDQWNGISTKGALFYSDHILGFGMEWEQLFCNDIFVSGFEWNKPCWQTLEGTIQCGTIETVYIKRVSRLHRVDDLSTSFAVNRYGLYQFSNAVNSWEFEGLLTYTFPSHHCAIKLLGNDSTLSLNYLIDKEQVEKRKKKRDPDGEKFAPLPIINREVHNWYVFMGKRISDNFAVEAYCGYSYDRVPRASMLPVGGVSAVLFRKEDIEARFDYNHSVSTENAQTVVDSFLWHLRYVY